MYENHLVTSRPTNVFTLVQFALLVLLLENASTALPHQP